MTDEDGVEERYQPTKDNLVRPPLPRVCPRSIYPNDAFPQRREIESFGSGVQPGDRLVFYCTNLSSQHSPSSALILPPTISRWPFGSEALQDEQ